MTEQDLSPEALAKGGKPATGWAIEAAKDIVRGSRAAIAEGLGIDFPTDPKPQETVNVAQRILAAIDEATAAAEASKMRLIQERDRATEARLRYAELVSAARDERAEAQATILRNLEASTATEDLLRETAEQRDEARAAARELGEALQGVKARAKKLRNSARLVGPTRYQDKPAFMKIWRQTRYDEGKMLCDFVREPLTKHAALLAEPEGKPQTYGPTRSHDGDPTGEDEEPQLECDPDDTGRLG